jgi:autotransporter-associated beta strand protein
MLCCGVFATPTRAGTTWDAGGGNTNFTTGANWTDDSAPTFTGGTSTLTFATAGSTATVDTAANLARIIFDRDIAFSIADGSGSLALAGETVGGVLTGITASPATAGTTVAYTISESIALGATQSWNVANNGAGGTSLSVSGVISGAGVGLTKIGSGTLTLSAANTFSGPLIVAEGVLSINEWNIANANGPLGNSAANVVLGSATSAGTLRYTGGNSNAPTTLRGIDLAAGGGVIQMGGTGRDGGYVHIEGSRITGSGQLTINSPGMTRFLVTGGSSGFSGPVRVQAGELQGNVTFSSGTYTPFGTGSNGLGSAMTIDSGAILSLWGGNNIGIALGSLAGSGTVRSESGAYTLRVGGDGTSTTFSGAITSGNALSLTKVGAGTLTLGGSSAYTGATQIAAGALLVNGTLGATAVTVQSGGLLGGSGLIGGSVSVLAGGTFSPGNSPGLLTSGPLSLAGTTLMEIDGLLPRGGVGGYDAADVNGLLTYGGSMLIDFGSGITSAFADNTTFSLFSFTSRSNSFSGISTASDGSFYAGLTFTNSGNNDKWTATKGTQTLEFTHSTGSLVIVPEPAAIALALSGIALGAGLRWRRRLAA